MSYNRECALIRWKKNEKKNTSDTLSIQLDLRLLLIVSIQRDLRLLLIAFVLTTLHFLQLETWSRVYRCALSLRQANEFTPTKGP